MLGRLEQGDVAGIKQLLESVELEEAQLGQLLRITARKGNVAAAKVAPRRPRPKISANFSPRRSCGVSGKARGHVARSPAS